MIMAVNVTSKAELSMEEEIYVEDYNLFIKLLFLVFGGISVTISMFALIAMNRTRRVPYVAKYLSKGLLTFDMLFIVTSTVRKFIVNPFINNTLTVSGNVFLQLAYITVAIMALERLLVFNWPNFYLRVCTKRKIRTITFTIWITVVTTFLFTRYVICYLRFKSDAVFNTAGQCNGIITIFYGIIVLFVQTTSCSCYLKIFRIVQTKSTSGNGDKRKLSFSTTATMLKSYKSTSLVIFYLFVITSTSLAYIVILVTIRYLDLGTTELRLSLDSVNVFNCILDPFLYAFRESRMQLLNFFSCFSLRLQSKTEQMKIEIFGIMTSQRYSLSSCPSTSATYLDCGSPELSYNTVDFK